jgi:prepilin-type N-terminal cleavage/methylation domain-containing protein
MSRPSTTGFTLVELIVCTAIIGMLAAAGAPVIGLQVAQSRVQAETATLQAYASAVKASFESTDLEGTNLAALAGTIPSGVDPTNFSPSTSPSYAPSSVSTADWYIKLARQLGYSVPSPTQGSPVSQVPAQTAAILYNPNHNARVMLEGPSNESGRQRFMMVSLMGDGAQLALPPLPNPSNPQDPANLALFNDVWNTDWSSSTATLPPTWTAALSASQARAWTGHLWQLCVQRIVCPEFNIIVNNSDPTLNCYVYYNFNGSTSGSSLSAAANSGSQMSPSPVFYGRFVQVWKGVNPPPDASATLFSSFVLRDHAEISLQD